MFHKIQPKSLIVIYCDYYYDYIQVTTEKAATTRHKNHTMAREQITEKAKKKKKYATLFFLCALQQGSIPQQTILFVWHPLKYELYPT